MLQRFINASPQNCFSNTKLTYTSSASVPIICCVYIANRIRIGIVTFNAVNLNKSEFRLTVDL